MKPLYILVLSAFLPFAVAAQEAPAVPAFAPLNAAEVTLAEFLWLKRPIVVFADSAADPAFITQMEMLAVDPAALELRDVVVVTDTDPAAKTEWRLKLRPRGFSLVLLDKDGEPELRKPLPWDLREITRAIDKFPLRRQEVLQQQPAGR
ncbi:MAG: DUF4174 domain-containing protein [Phaeovulum sp.]|uniref:DUF4174 domain-containing protein n=1 Tax=Phaeovulum sp. TaxID=2934796 RepID=UPI00272FA68A|nr:DUF4174 domain-containing protein [Phaeovulum sp.]MDP2062574.1 DUF4174 domain-containing protein [Phaeovulum sp.]MDP3861007.1 DUF4174 domain-containing protein [Phaeovulum sp.]